MLPTGNTHAKTNHLPIKIGNHKPQHQRTPLSRPSGHGKEGGSMNSFLFFGLALVCVGWMKSDTDSALLMVRSLDVRLLAACNLPANNLTISLDC